MNVKIVAEVAKFPEKEYINGIAVAVRGLFGVGFKGFQKCWKYVKKNLKAWTKLFAWLADFVHKNLTTHMSYTPQRREGEKGDRESVSVLFAGESTTVMVT